MRNLGKVAFVLRYNTSWMNGHYGLPSGKVEHDESYLAAAVREGKEETGVDIDSSDLGYLLTMHRKENDKHENIWVDVFFEAKRWQGEPFNAEPDKHSELAWLDPKKLPDNIIPSVKFAIEQIEIGKNYAEYGWDQIRT
jgi:8-oxo-dGTP diphosphatase